MQIKIVHLEDQYLLYEEDLKVIDVIFMIRIMLVFGGLYGELVGCFGLWMSFGVIEVMMKLNYVLLYYNIYIIY